MRPLRIDKNWWCSAETIGPVDQAQSEAEVALSLRLHDDHQHVTHIVPVIAGRIAFHDRDEDRWVTLITATVPGIPPDAVAVLLLGIIDLMGQPSDDDLASTPIDLDTWISSWFHDGEGSSVSERLHEYQRGLVSNGILMGVTSLPLCCFRLGGLN